MNKIYNDEVSENLTTFVTAFIFVGYTTRERKRKHTIAFVAVTWYFLQLLTIY